MAKDAYHCEGHASKVTESVSNKNSRWELVVLDKSKSHHNKWNDDYKKQKYNFMSREDIIVFVKRILNKVI